MTGPELCVPAVQAWQLSAVFSDGGAGIRSGASSARRPAHTRHAAGERPPPEAARKPRAAPRPPAQERRPAVRLQFAVAGQQPAAEEALQSPHAATEAAAAMGDRYGYPRQPARPSPFRAELLIGPVSFSYAERDAEAMSGFQRRGIECFYQSLTTTGRRLGLQLRLAALIANGNPGNSNTPPHSNGSVSAGPIPKVAPPCMENVTGPKR